MKAFWKNHPALRMVLMLALFVLSIALVTAGWKMTGQLAGLGIMLAGVARCWLCWRSITPPIGIEEKRGKGEFPWKKIK